jgi:hypothetical protein
MPEVSFAVNLSRPARLLYVRLSSKKGAHAVLWVPCAGHLARFLRDAGYEESLIVAR